MPAHTTGREGNLPVETLIRSLRMLIPSDGALGAPIAGHHLCRFVPHSGCSGSTDPTQWVLPSNVKLWQTPQQLWDPFWIW
jgi:hypothetical protein